MKFRANVDRHAYTSHYGNNFDFYNLRLNPNVTYIPLLFIDNKTWNLEKEISSIKDYLNHTLTFSDLLTSGYISSSTTNNLNYKNYLDRNPYIKAKVIKRSKVNFNHLKNTLISACLNYDLVISIDVGVSLQMLKFENSCRAVTKHYIGNNDLQLINSIYKNEKIVYFNIPYGMFTTRKDEHISNGVKTEIYVPDTLQYVLTIHKDYALASSYIDGEIDSQHYKLFVRHDLLSENTMHPHLKNYFNKVVIPFCKENEIEIIAVPDLTKMYHRTIKKPKSLKDTNILVDQAIKRYEECAPLLIP